MREITREELIERAMTFEQWWDIKIASNKASDYDYVTVEDKRKVFEVACRYFDSASEEVMERDEDFQYFGAYCDTYLNDEFVKNALKKEWYSDEDLDVIMKWLKKCGVKDCDREEVNNWIEYKHGQLYEVAKENLIDSIYDWDRWQHLQYELEMEISWEMASKFNSFLYENDIDVMDLESYEHKKEGK